MDPARVTKWYGYIDHESDPDFRCSINAVNEATNEPVYITLDPGSPTSLADSIQDAGENQDPALDFGLG